MNTELTFRLIAIVFIVVLFGGSGYFRRKADRQAGALRTTEGQRAVLYIRLFVLAAWLPILAYFINPAWVTWAQWPLPLWLRWVGVGLAAVVVPLGYWVFISIGQNISPTSDTRHGHQLVTHGPYRFVRHPLYSVGLLAYTALALMTALWWVLVGLLPAWIFIILRTPREEARLTETFGDAYHAYMQRTGRFVPKLF